MLITESVKAFAAFIVPSPGRSMRVMKAADSLAFAILLPPALCLQVETAIPQQDLSQRAAEQENRALLQNVIVAEGGIVGGNRLIIVA